MDAPHRNVRRKAETRRRIIAAANSLFGAKGYAATSMDDISVAADVAIRTIYLHFDSKAAVLLAHFEEWLAEFVRLFAERPLGEPLDVMTQHVLEIMAEEGWNDNLTVAQMAVLHPVVEFIGDGEPEIAGKILHGWVRAQNDLAEIFRQRAGEPADSVAPRVEAAAVFAVWMASILTMRENFLAHATSFELSSHDVGEVAMRAMVNGLGQLRPAQPAVV